MKQVSDLLLTVINQSLSTFSKLKCSSEKNSDNTYVRRPALASKSITFISVGGDTQR